MISLLLPACFSFAIIMIGSGGLLLVVSYLFAARLTFRLKFGLSFSFMGGLGKKKEKN
jgi:hypothetical protein